MVVKVVAVVVVVVVVVVISSKPGAWHRDCRTRTPFSGMPGVGELKVLEGFGSTGFRVYRVYV